MFDKRSCQNKTYFCVSKAGKTIDVRTKKKCYDPKVDEICRETVKKWRFKPFIVAGKPQKTCSTVQFDLKFNK
jgi:protein TonB